MTDTYKELLQSALSEIKILKSKLAKKTSNANEEKIAVVGMSCRFGDGIDTPEKFSEFLRGKGDAIGELPEGRWSEDWKLDERSFEIGSAYTARGGYFSDVWRFDNRYFDIPDREAEYIDPQQRHLLELSVLALDDAGELSRCNYTNTGMFMTTGEVNYAERTLLSNKQSRKTGIAKLGTNRGVGIGRIAHILKLEGPAIFIDTTCSSSLVSIHLACESLRRNETNMALAGGFNLMLSSNDTVGFCGLQALSPDGKCRAFDKDANGYVRGEGGGVVVLKRLSDAIRDGNPVYGLVHGGAINNDGESNGLTAPSGIAQQKVIRKALENANVEPFNVVNIEAHGTGTVLGDPIELNALARVLRSGENSDLPLTVGSVKTNLGHLEAAAGMASFIKVILSYNQGKIFPSLNYHSPNPNFQWQDHPIKVAEGGETLGFNDYTGISGFGMSGTNAHVIVSGFDCSQLPEVLSEPKYPILSFSAHSSLALKSQLIEFANRKPLTTLEDIRTGAAVTNYQRLHHNYRAAFCYHNFDQLHQEISSYANQLEPFEVPNGKNAFMFTGQGSQFEGMGASLYKTEEFFKKTIDQLSPAFERYVGILPEVLMWGEKSSLLQKTEYQQPALVVYQYALARLLMEQGVKPDVLLGHSLGEFVAAVISGIFTIEEAISLVTVRGRLISKTQLGRMMVVWCSKDYLHEIGLPENVWLAAENTQETIVVSGAVDAIESLGNVLDEKGIRIKELSMQRGFHSPMLQPICELWLEALSKVSFRPPQFDIICNVGGKLDGHSMACAEYWYKQIVGAVEFKQCLETLSTLNIANVVEFGPIAQLSKLGEMHDNSIHWLAVNEEQYLNDARCDLNMVKPVMAELWAKLYQVGFDVPRSKNKTKISNIRFSNYKFLGKDYCLKQDGSPVKSSEPEGEWVYDAISIAGEEKDVLQIEVGGEAYPHMDDHKVLGNLVTAAACYLSMIISYVNRCSSYNTVTLRDVVFKEINIRSADRQKFQLKESLVDNYRKITLFALNNENLWRELVQCSVGEEGGALVPQSTCSAKEYSGYDYYKKLDDIGYQLGSSYRWLQYDGVLSLSRPPEEQYWNGSDWHPGLIDSCFHSLVCELLVNSDSSDLMLPFYIEELKCGARTTQASEFQIKTDAQIFPDGLKGSFDLTSNGSLCFQVKSLHMRKTDLGLFKSQNLLHELRWVKTSFEERLQGNDQWLCIEDDQGGRQELLSQDCLMANIGGRENIDWALVLVEEKIVEDKEGRLVVFVPGFTSGTPELSLSLCYEMKSLLSYLEEAKPYVEILFVFGWNGEAENCSAVQMALWSMLACAEKELTSLSLGRLLWMDNDKELPKVIRSIPTSISARFYQGRFEAVRIDRIHERHEARRKNSGLGVALVTGANGSIAFEISKSILTKGCNRLVLHSRKGLDSDKLIELLSISGDCEISQVKGDLANDASFDDLNHLLGNTPLDVVYHLAGNIADKPFRGLTKNDFDEVFRAKVFATTKLDAWLQNRNDKNTKFIAFSSLSSVLGNPGQGNYSAANGFLDGLMISRRSKGLHGVSINLGPWNIGLIKESQIDRLRRFGLDAIDVAKGIPACIDARDFTDSQLVVANIDYKEISHGYMDSPWQSYFSNQEENRVESSDSIVSSENNLLAHLIDVIGSYTSVDPASHLSDSLIEIGVSSLTILELKQVIYQSFAVDVSVGSLFQMSIQDLCNEILSKCSVVGDAPQDEEETVDYNVQPQWDREESGVVEL